MFSLFFISLMILMSQVVIFLILSIIHFHGYSQHVCAGGGHCNHDLLYI